MEEILAHGTLEGKVSLEAARRPSMKLNSKPRIVVCMPIGTKPKANVFETPDGAKWVAPAASVPATVPVQWVVANMRMVPPLGIALSYLYQWGLLSGEARQIMTSRAMSIVQDDGYVLYWDDDVIVEPMSLYTLYSFMEQHPEAGLVTGVYSTRQDPTEPVIYKEHMKGAAWGITVGPNAEPEEIFGCGAGFMLVRAQAVRDMIAANPGVPVWADSKAIPMAQAQNSSELRFTTSWGHDLRFCRLMAEAGWKLYVDGRVELGHFDAIEQREYRLPEDSPPKVRGRKMCQSPAEDDNSICLILPTYGHLDYAARAARSFLENTRHSRAIVCAVDDGSQGVTDEQYAAWAVENGIQHAKRFADNDGLTRSWNYGLQFCRENGMRYAVCGNSDLVFSPGWDKGILAALEEYDLVGPVTNAPGWGSFKQAIQRFFPDYEPNDSDADIADKATRISGHMPDPLGNTTSIAYGARGASINMPEFLNGFCLVARTRIWWVGAFDELHVFDPSHKLTENETELQVRWVIGMRCRRAVVPSSFVFHYRSISRGDEHMSKGAFRPVATVAQ